MKEILIHHFWSSSYLLNRKLILSDGRILYILNQGSYNTNSGPDFLNSIIEIDGLRWYGNIEIHVSTSDWIKHKHNKDKAYSRIILHVVFNDDVTLENNPPTLELGKLVSEDEIRKHSSSKNLFKKRNIGSALEMKNIELLYIQRLKRKEIQIEKDLHRTKNDWQEVLYISLARGFGFSVNSQPFEALALSLPLSILRQHANELVNLESLIFGQSGLLEEIEEPDNYVKLLKHKYLTFQLKYTIESLPASSWKFSKMRPLNFPTIRLAQFASMISNFSNIVNALFDNPSTNDLYSLLKNDLTEYWKNHYTFQKVSKEKPKELGTSSFESIYINSIVPFLSIHEQVHGVENNINSAINRVKRIKAEDNKSIRVFAEKNKNYSDALESQALVELSFNYNG